jgi:hypothetical protein
MELRRRAAPPHRARRCPRRVPADRAVLVSLAAARATPWCYSRVKPSPSSSILWRTSETAAVRRRPSLPHAHVRPRTLDQDLTVLINLTAVACAAAAAGRWI